MKKSLQLLVLALLLFSSSKIFSQGFNDVTSPDGVYAIAVGDNGLIFRSSNGGTTWASYTVNGDDYKSVCSIGDDVWFAGQNGNVYQTKKSNSPISSANVGVASMLNSVYFINSAVGFTCGDGGILYKSVDGGDTWSSSNTGISSVKLNSISFKDLNNGVVVGDNGTIYTTSNGGTSWVSLASGTSRNLLDARYFSDGFAITGEYGTLLMKPNSSSLSSVNTRINTDIRSVSGTNMTDIHVCGGGGFIRNNKSGSSDFKNFEINPMLKQMSDLHYANTNTGFAVSNETQAIIKTTDGGTSWSLTAGANVSFQWEVKLPTSLVGGSSRGNNLCQHPTNRNAVFVAMDNDVFVSYDKGDTWMDIANIPGSFPHSFYVSPNDTNVWVAAVVRSTDEIIKSTNYGATWTTSIAKNFSNYGQPLEMDQNDPSVFYFAPDGGGFYKSTDNGSTFNLISSYAFRSPCDLLVEYDNSNVIFVADGVTGNGQAEIFKSSNGGVNWTLSHTAGASEVPSMCNTKFDNSIVYSTEWSGQKLYKSTNGGDNFFTLITSTGSSGWASGVAYDDPTVVLTGSYSSKAFLSTNAGANFNTLSFSGGSGGNTTGAGQLVPERGYFLDMRTRSVWKMKVTYSVVTSVQEVTLSTIAPSKYALYQNYPNPFNPSTKIKYDVPAKGLVKLKVYNQLGKEVSELVNTVKSPGSYLIDFDGSSLSSGIYFYKLETAENVITKKMILVK